MHQFVPLYDLNILLLDINPFSTLSLTGIPNYIEETAGPLPYTRLGLISIHSALRDCHFNHCIYIPITTITGFHVGLADAVKGSLNLKNWKVEMGRVSEKNCSICFTRGGWRLLHLFSVMASDNPWCELASSSRGGLGDVGFWINMLSLYPKHHSSPINHLNPPFQPISNWPNHPQPAILQCCPAGRDLLQQQMLCQ